MQDHTHLFRGKSEVFSPLRLLKKIVVLKDSNLRFCYLLQHRQKEHKLGATKKKFFPAPEIYTEDLNFSLYPPSCQMTGILSANTKGNE